MPVSPSTQEKIDMLAHKRRQRGPDFAAQRQRWLDWSGKWWPQAGSDAAPKPGYDDVLRLSQERTPTNRVCLPLDQEHWFTSMVPQLRGMRYRRIPVRDAGEAWYFVERLDQLRKLLAACRPEMLRAPAKDEDSWRHRIVVPYVQERYHTHLADYLRNRGVRVVRVACETLGYSVYFLTTLTDVLTLLDGLTDGAPSRDSAPAGEPAVCPG